MPLYEFCCEECGETVEVLQHFTDDPPEHCDEPMRRVLAGGKVALDFKGDCWAKDGYTRKTKKEIK